MTGETKPRPKPVGTGRTMAAVLLCGFAAFGGAVPHLLPLDLDARYTATTTLAVPLNDTSVGLPADAENLLLKPQVMDRIVRALGQSGEAMAAPQSATAFLRDLFTGEAMTIDRSDAVARARVQDMLNMIVSPDRHFLTLTATADTASEASGIANTAAQVLRQEMQDTASSSTDDAVENARRALEQAQVALDNLPVSESDLAQARQQESQRFQLEADSASVRAQQQNLDERLQLLSGLKPASLISQGFPNALRGTPLEAQRQAYLDASLRVDQLSVSLGPKHPTLVAAQGAADEARAALSKALAQTVTETNRKKAVLDAEAERLRSALAALDAKAVPDVVRQHQDLEQAVDTARKSYLDALRAERHAPAPKPAIELIRAASAADASVAGLPSWLYSLMGALAGLCLGGACIPGRKGQYDHASDEGPEELDHFIEPQILPDLPAVEEEKSLELEAGTIPQAETLDLPVPPVFDDYYRSSEPNDEGLMNADERVDLEAEDDSVLAAAAMFAEVANDDRSREWLTALLEANVQTDPPQLPPLLERALAESLDRAQADAEARMDDQVEPEVAELEELLEQLAILRRELAAAEERERAA